MCGKINRFFNLHFKFFMQNYLRADRRRAVDIFTLGDKDRDILF